MYSISFIINGILWKKGNNLRKIILLVLFFISGYLFADNNIRIEIHNVLMNADKVYVGTYFNETAYKNQKQNMIIEIEPTNNIISTVINLPNGEYVLDAYQDTNNNGVLDFGLFNIPKEPIGITNYNGGIPGNFNKHKVLVNNRTEFIRINLR